MTRKEYGIELEQNEINTGIKCPNCGAGDCRKYELKGYFPTITYVCPKCAKPFRIEEQPLPSALVYQLPA